jgi:hypothetical protein
MITRENYEEFFLLYIDNELPVAARAAVATFVDENPDLREEWETLLQCRVEPEVEAVYPFKNELLKEEQESLLLSYVDGELDVEARAAVDNLVSRHPSSAAELQRLLLTVSEPDRSVVFPNKESLYRTERRRRLVPLLWMRAGVAAAVLTTGVLLFLNRPHGKETLPVAVTTKKDAGPVTPHAATSLYPEKARASAQMIKPEMNRTGSAPASEKRNVKLPSQDLVIKTAPLRDRPIAPAVTTDTVSTTRDVAIATTTKPDKAGTPPMINTPAVDNTLAMINTPAVVNTPPLVNTLAAPIPKDQSSFATQALLQESQDNEADNIVADAPSGKTKLRRIFRRVSRAFGKTADRDDDGQRQVLISAFQVALK